MSEFDAIGMAEAAALREAMQDAHIANKSIGWLRVNGYIVAVTPEDAAEALRERGYAVISPRDMESFRYIGGSCPVCGGGQ